jgi:hypothetical protein
MFEQKELAMKAAKFEGLLSRCNSESLSTGERLLSGVSLLLSLVVEYFRLRREAERLNGLSREFERLCSVHLDRGCSRSDSLLSELLRVSEAPNIERVKEYQRDRQALSESETILSQYLAAFNESRDKLLNLKTVNRIQAELASLLLSSERNGDKWQGKVCETDSLAICHFKHKYKIGVISGGVVRIIGRLKNEPVSVSRFLSVPILRERLNVKGRKNGAVSRTRGEKLWERVPCYRSLSFVAETCYSLGQYILNTAYTETEQRKLAADIERAAETLAALTSDRERLETIGEIEERLCSELRTYSRESQEYSDRFDTIQQLKAERESLKLKHRLNTWPGDRRTAFEIVHGAELRAKQALENAVNLQRERGWRAASVAKQTETLRSIGRDFLTIEKSLFCVHSSYSFRRSGVGQGQHFSAASLSLVLFVRRLLPVESLAALRRLCDVSTLGKREVTQLVIGRAESVGVKDFTYPHYSETQTLSLPVVLVPVLSLYTGEQQTEVCFGRTGDSETDSLLSLCTTYHTSDSVETARENLSQPESSLLGVMLRNLKTAIAQREARLAAERDRAAAEQKRRKETAALALSLRRIETVSIADSLNTGNCLPGTREFCSRWGIFSETISGRELAAKWRKANWEQNYMFVRVVKSVVEKAGVK